MPAKGACKVCDHPKVDNINIMLLRGERVSVLSKMYKISIPTLNTHLREHLNNVIIKSGLGSLENKKKEVEESKAEKDLPLSVGEAVVNNASPIRALEWHVDHLYSKIIDVINHAEDREDHDLLLRGVREGRAMLEMIVKASEVLVEREKSANLSGMIRDLMEVVKDMPDVRKKMSRAIRKGNYV